MRENYGMALTVSIKTLISDRQSIVRYGMDTDLDLVGHYFDTTIDDSLHMFRVEVAEAEMFNSLVCLEILKGFDILVVAVLFKSVLPRTI